jgi:hypothetical protein
MSGTVSQAHGNPSDTPSRGREVNIVREDVEKDTYHD